MPHVSSIFPKLVSAVTILMPPSNNTINAMKCEFFRNKFFLPSILLFLDAYEFDDTWYSLIISLFCSQCQLLNIFAKSMYTESIF